MKNLLTIALALIVFASFGCQKEDLTQDMDAPEISNLAQEGHYRPDAQCGTSAFVNLYDDSQISRGTIEVLNDEKNVYILLSMNPGWRMNSMELFAGMDSNLPRNNGSNVLTEEFSERYFHGSPVTKYTYVLSKDALPACMDIAAKASATQYNHFGGQIATKNIWADGSSSTSGYTFNYCAGTCNAQPSASTNN